MFRSARDVVNIPKPDSAESNGPDLYGCDLCSDGGWVSETEVELHKTKEHYTKAFLKSVWNRGDYCCICVKKCDSKEEVLKHIKREHLLSSEQSLRVEREIFVCDICTAVFFNQKNLLIHLRYSHKASRNNATVMCMLCARNIRTRNIPGHFYMHQIQSVSTCRICLEKFRNTRVLEKHMRRHPLFLRCSMCQFATDRSESFHDHVLETHKNLSKNVSSMTDDKQTRGSLLTDEKKSDDGSIPETNHYEVYCDDNDDSGMFTVIQICDDEEITDDTTDGKGLTVNDLISDVVKDELDDTDLMTADVKREPSSNEVEGDLMTMEVDTNEGLMAGEIKKENESKLMTDDAKHDNDMEDLIMDDVKDDVQKSMITEDVVNTNVSDFRRFFIPKKSAFVKLQKVAGIKGLILTNNVHICVLCREICVGSQEMRLHIYEHTYKVTEKKYEYECSCGEGFHSKLLLRHHTFKTKHVVGAK